MTDQLRRIGSGISGLDIVLKGGFFKGGLYLIQGAPGTGKTTIANQICFHGVTQGYKSVYVTLLTEYHARMVQYIGRMSFFDEARLPDDINYISGFNVMRSEGLAALLTLIRRELLGRKAAILVIDGLIAAQRVAPNEQSFNEFIHELQGLAIAADCSVFLIASTERTSRSTPEHTLVDGIVELSDDFFGWTAVRTLQVTKIRGSSFLRGKHSYQITNDGVVVYPRTESLLIEPTTADRPLARRVTSGIADLDLMLHGGLPEGSTTIFVGPSGVGKTTFGLEFLSACSMQQRGLMLGLYEMPSRIRAKAEQICAPLVNLFDDGTVEMIWQPPTNDLLDAYAERLLCAVRRRGVRRLFLDGLGALQKSPALGQRMHQFLPALTNELRAQGVTTVYSFESGNVVGSSPPISLGDLSVVAENLISLRYVEDRDQLHRLISIMKVRDSDFDPLLRNFVLTTSGPCIELDRNVDTIVDRGASRDLASVTKPT